MEEDRELPDAYAIGLLAPEDLINCILLKFALQNLI